MAVSYIGGVATTGAANGGTTAGVNTTGANLIVIGITHLSGTTASVSDSNSNTYTALTAITSGEHRSRLYYCLAPTVGSGHTFTLSGTGIYGAAFVQYFSGIDSYDKQNGGTSAGTTVQPGSVTPTNADSLLVTAAADRAAGTISIDGSYTISNQQGQTGVSYGGGMAYLIQAGGPSASNPTWTHGDTSGFSCATIAVFVPSAGGGGSSIVPISMRHYRQRRA